MKIKSVHLKNFRRFTDMTIEGLPETARLVVMIGPNGCGKSSVFDAMNSYTDQLTLSSDIDYRDKYYKDVDYLTKSNEPRYYFSYYKSKHQDQTQRMQSYEWDIHNSRSPGRTWYDVIIDFHGETKPFDYYENDKRFRVRTAYRNSSVTLPHTIDRVDLVKERSPYILIENDNMFASNYWKLAFQWLERSSEIGENPQDLVDLQNEVFGELHDAMGNLFNDPPLVLKNLGNPSDGDLFQFGKGTSERFSFQNLASGEKAALDLLLDIIVTKAEYDETIFCIDEPEAHIHTKLQGQLLEELYNLIPEKSQLWIATHSVGMVRKAQDLWREDPDSVVFLDFGKDDSGQDRNFDDKVEITPAKPSPNLWGQTYSVALGDLSELIASEHYVFCEGEGFDEECYQNIFKERFPVTRFISIGGRNNVVNTVSKLKGKIAKAAKVSGVVDRDRATEPEIEEAAKKEVRTLSRKTIESYLLDDEVLKKLCEHYDKPDEIQNLLTAKNEALKKRTSEGKSKSLDDLKPIAQDIHVAAQNALKSVNLGNSKESFMRDRLAPLIQPGMKVYEELHEDIFGE